MPMRWCCPKRDSRETPLLPGQVHPKVVVKKSESLQQDVDDLLLVQEHGPASSSCKSSWTQLDEGSDAKHTVVLFNTEGNETLFLGDKVQYLDALPSRTDQSLLSKASTCEEEAILLSVDDALRKDNVTISQAGSSGATSSRSISAMQAADEETLEVDLGLEEVRAHLLASLDSGESSPSSALPTSPCRRVPHGIVIPKLPLAKVRCRTGEIVVAPRELVKALQGSCSSSAVLLESSFVSSHGTSSHDTLEDSPLTLNEKDRPILENQIGDSECSTPPGVAALVKETMRSQQYNCPF